MAKARPSAAAARSCSGAINASARERFAVILAAVMASISARGPAASAFASDAPIARATSVPAGAGAALAMRPEDRAKHRDRVASGRACHRRRSLADQAGGRAARDLSHEFEHGGVFGRKGRASAEKPLQRGSAHLNRFGHRVAFAPEEGPFQSSPRRATRLAWTGTSIRPTRRVPSQPSSPQRMSVSTGPPLHVIKKRERYGFLLRRGQGSRRAVGPVPAARHVGLVAGGDDVDPVPMREWAGFGDGEAHALGQHHRGGKQCLVGVSAHRRRGRGGRRLIFLPRAEVQQRLAKALGQRGLGPAQCVQPLQAQVD